MMKRKSYKHANPNRPDWGLHVCIRNKLYSIFTFFGYALVYDLKKKHIPCPLLLKSLQKCVNLVTVPSFHTLLLRYHPEKYDKLR